jgi:DNA-binding XRE family transcriptional regulator
VRAACFHASRRMAPSCFGRIRFSRVCSRSNASNCVASGWLTSLHRRPLPNLSVILCPIARSLHRSSFPTNHASLRVQVVLELPSFLIIFLHEEMNVYTSFGHLRTTLGLTQRAMAGVVGCSVHTVEALEQKRLKLSPKLALKTARACNVDAEWLMANDETLPLVNRGRRRLFARRL